METEIYKELVSFEQHRGRFCPFIHKLLTDCHCSDMRSMKVEEAIYYCGANYGKCGIYKMLKTGGKDIQFLSDSVCREKI